MPTALWWGRLDPDYSRNRILRGLLSRLGWRVADFRPRFSGPADWEARLRKVPRPDLVWVPCFRQRDLAAASRWARREGVPLLFDPLISAYDKQVFERDKHAPESAGARRLLARERGLFQRADLVLADTPEHARFFKACFGLSQARLSVVYVGAEEPLFSADPGPEKAPGDPPEALFFGSFIALQGAPVIIEAARRYRGPALRWTLIGAGPELERCRRSAAGLPNVGFEPWVEYSALPDRIRRADILLGIFGTTAKAGRVIPNKVFQALACGRPVVTRRSAAYPAGVAARTDQGVYWVEAGDPDGLAAVVADLARTLPREPGLGRRAADLYTEAFSNRVILAQLRDALASLQGLRSR
jgi:glycosyltransferase involved in cell wall biosynthesis